MKLVSANASLLRSLSEGADDKELDRLLEKHFAAGGTMQLVCGDSFVIKRVREHSHEHENIPLLNSMIPSEHAVQVRRLIASRWLVLQRVPPVFASMQSMHDLLTHSRTVPSDVIQSCLAQIVALLVTAQARDPGFAHNDFKADNILLCLESRPSPIAIGDFEVAHVGVRVVLIDLETVTGTSFPPVHLPDLPRDKLEVFGIDPSMPWCEWTDFHLLCMELFRSVRTQKPKWAQACLEFLAACCPTLRMFFTYEDKNILVTSMNRLSTKGRKTVNALLDVRAMKHLTEVAELPFLAPWLTHQNSKAAAEMSEKIPTQTPMDNETT